MKAENIMKKVLLYSSGKILEENPTGGEYRFLELADYFAGREWAELCCADDETKLAERNLCAGIHLNPPLGKAGILPEEARIWLANRRILRQISKKGYRAVIAFDVPPATGLVLSGVKNLVLMIRKDLIGYERVKNRSTGIGKKLKIGYLWACEGLCLNHARKVICQCQYDRTALLNRHPMIRKKIDSRIIVQINNDNPSWIAEKARAAGYTEKRQTGSDMEKMKNRSFRICFVGGFDDPRKGQNMFLQAAEELSRKYSDMTFTLVGGGRKLEEYKKKYQSEKITFKGRMENPLSVLMECSLAVVPSLADSCPNTVMEALYIGTPVIGSKAGGIPEILQDEQALFETDWASLEAKIEECYLNRECYETIRKRQKTRARELAFNWPEIITELITGEEKQEN